MPILVPSPWVWTVPGTCFNQGNAVEGTLCQSQAWQLLFLCSWEPWTGTSGARPPYWRDHRGTTWTEGGLTSRGGEVSNPADGENWRPRCVILRKPFRPASSHLCCSGCAAGHGRQEAILDLATSVDRMCSRDKLSLLSPVWIPHAQNYSGY